MANRLQYEDSPYLQEHKESLVDWWPWCQEALKRAKNEHKAIFISIGYSSCELCQLMEKSIFLNAEYAAILNEHFISIKIDKEERPDIDKYYQGVYKLLNNSTGGWPASIFCTPNNKPFLARTYLAAELIEGSSEGLGFKEITQIIAAKIKENDTKLFENAQEVDEFLKKVNHPKEATHLKEEFYKNFLLQAKNNFDALNGGFGTKPKFPHATTLLALCLIAKNYNNEEAKSMLLRTLDAMKQGEIYDHEDGGFFRYAKNSQWQDAHQEKTLYDNALLCSVFTNAYLLFKDASYLQIAKASADFWRNLMSENALFYSSSYKHRETQEYLNVDTKIQTSWSSLMIHSLFELGSIDENYKRSALIHLDALLDASYRDTRLYHSTLPHKVPTVEAFLEDYAFLARALLSAYSATSHEHYLIKAQCHTNKALELFYKRGVWYFSVGEYATQAEAIDKIYISAVSVMIEVLLTLGELLKDEKYKHFAFKTLEYNSYELGRKPLLMPSMLIQMLHYLNFKSF